MTKEMRKSLLPLLREIKKLKKMGIRVDYIVKFSKEKWPCHTTDKATEKLFIYRRRKNDGYKHHKTNYLYSNKRYPTRNEYMQGPRHDNCYTR